MSSPARSRSTSPARARACSRRRTTSSSCRRSPSTASRRSATSRSPSSPPSSSSRPPMSEQASEYPGYEALLPWHHRQPFDGVEQFPCVIRREDAPYLSWSPVPGNAMATWVYVGTRRLNQGTFYVEPGHWFDAGNHPNPEPYYVLRGSADALESRHVRRRPAAGGRRREHPGARVPPRLERRPRDLRDPLVGAGRDAHRRVQARDLDPRARRVAVVPAAGGDAERRPRPQRRLPVAPRRPRAAGLRPRARRRRSTCSTCPARGGSTSCTATTRG